MITVEILGTAVAKMRKAQNDYFQSRTNRHLSEAKATQAEVDRLLKELAPTSVGIPSGFVHSRQRYLDRLMISLPVEPE